MRIERAEISERVARVADAAWPPERLAHSPCVDLSARSCRACKGRPIPGPLGYNSGAALPLSSSVAPGLPSMRPPPTVQVLDTAAVVVAVPTGVTVLVTEFR